MPAQAVKEPVKNGWFVGKTVAGDKFWVHPEGRAVSSEEPLTYFRATRLDMLAMLFLTTYFKW
jgi:hypothetical protein